MIKMSWAFLISTILVSAAFLFLAVAFWGVGYKIVIHFDIFQGIDILDSPSRALAAVIFAGFVNIIFIALARFLNSREPFLAWGLALGNVGFMALTLVSAIVIIISN